MSYAFISNCHSVWQGAQRISGVGRADARQPTAAFCLATAIGIVALCDNHTAYITDRSGDGGLCISLLLTGTLPKLHVLSRNDADFYRHIHSATFHVKTATLEFLLAVAPSKEDRLARGTAGKVYLAYLRDPSGNKICALHHG